MLWRNNSGNEANNKVTIEVMNSSLFFPLELPPLLVAVVITVFVMIAIVMEEGTHLESR